MLIGDPVAGGRADSDPDSAEVMYEGARKFVRSLNTASGRQRAQDSQSCAIFQPIEVTSLFSPWASFGRSALQRRGRRPS
jgi:hypothetical protein